LHIPENILLIFKLYRLTRLFLKLDNIHIGDREEVRRARKKATTTIDRYSKLLLSKISERNDGGLEERTQSMDTNSAANQDSGTLGCHHDARLLAESFVTEVDIHRPSCIELGKIS